MNKIIKDWNDKNYPLKIINIKVNTFWFILLLVSILLLAFSVIYLGYNDKFKSNIDCGNTTLICESVKVPSCPICPECPSFECPDIIFEDNICNFPNITINLNNSY